LRFDVPVLGLKTLEVAHASGILTIACEAKKTLLLDREELIHTATQYGITLVAVSE
jgi:DUF1009 family protein